MGRCIWKQNLSEGNFRDCLRATARWHNCSQIHNAIKTLSVPTCNYPLLLQLRDTWKAKTIKRCTCTASEEEDRLDW